MTNQKPSWAETAAAMAAARESWGDWDQTASDGLDLIAWETNGQGQVPNSEQPPGNPETTDLSEE